MQVLEALALDEPIPESVEDETMPVAAGMETQSAEILAFRVSAACQTTPWLSG